MLEKLARTFASKNKLGQPTSSITPADVSSLYWDYGTHVVLRKTRDEREAGRTYEAFTLTGLIKGESVNLIYEEMRMGRKAPMKYRMDKQPYFFGIKGG